MRFLNLSSLFLALAMLTLGTAAVAVWRGALRRRRRLATLVAPPLDAALAASVHTGRRRLRDILLFLGLTCVLTALARPWWGNHLVPAPSRSRDLLFVVDASRSMLATDVAPSRLEHAKWFTRELATRFPGDRFGLIAFAGDALLQCPLTQDINTLHQFVNALDTRTIPVGGTNLGRALQVARQAFRAAEDRNRAVVLITDGEELEGAAAGEAAALKAANIPLLIAGLGDPNQGSLVQLEDKVMLRDKDGNLVRTRLNEDGLRRLAAETGGIYAHSTSLAANLEPVARRISDLVPAEGTPGTRQRPIERFQIPLAAGLFLLILRLLISERREPGSPLWPRPRRPAVRAAAAVPIVLTLLLAAGLLERNAAGSTTAAPEQNVTLPPSPAAEPIAVVLPKDAPPRELYNFGVKRQEAGDAAVAAQAYQSVQSTRDDHLVKGRALQNLGVLQHEDARRVLEQNPEAAIQKLKGARSCYRESLRQQPFSAQAARDLELAEADLIRAEQAAKQKQEQQKQENQQKQDQEKAKEQLKQARDLQNKANQQQQQSAQDKLQKDAQQKTQDAEKSLDKAQQKPAPGQSQASQEAMKQAADSVRQAEADQKQAAAKPAGSPERKQLGDQAKQHLDDAIRQLEQGSDPDKDKKDGQNGQKPQDKPAEAGKEPQAGNPNDGQPLDATQAAALLRQMQEQENDFREAIKQQQQNRQIAEPDRNW